MIKKDGGYMDDKEKKIEEYNDRFMKRILKSALYTFFIFLFTMFGVAFIIGLVFDTGDTSLIISFCISIIFTIFFCTMTIIEEMKIIK